MSRVRGKNTSLEKMVFSYLRREGVYFQRHYRKISGCPDLAVPSKKKAVFLDGGFWHGWKLERRKNLPLFWKTKIAANVRRDLRSRARIKRKGWKVLRVWDHQLDKYPEIYLRKIASFLRES